MSIKEKLKKINENISQFAQKSDIKLVAVSKYASDEQVLEAYAEGVKIFGESYVSPALDRISRLNPYLHNIEWHLLGSLQKNKVNKVVGAFQVIQSVDSIELLEKIDKRSANLNIKQAILLQINISNEPQKHGFSPKEFIHELPNILRYENVELRGLMALNAKSSSQEKLDESFKILRSLLSLLKQEKPNTEFELSVGMSGDYVEALKRGSSMVRVGEALFG